jgi:hypothetical protein
MEVWIQQLQITNPNLHNKTQVFKFHYGFQLENRRYLIPLMPSYKQRISCIWITNASGFGIKVNFLDSSQKQIGGLKNLNAKLKMEASFFVLTIIKSEVEPRFHELKTRYYIPMYLV